MIFGKVRQLVKASTRHFSQELHAFRKALRRRALISKSLETSITDRFHHLYYASAAHGLTWGDTHWLGTKTMKCPLDLWIYQEIIHEVRPDIIIETGTFQGGSALFMASVLDQLGHGEIITIDLEERDGRPRHSRIQYILGSSTAPAVVDAVREKAKNYECVMLILDSSHRKDHVLEELRSYHDIVTDGSYIIVEDTNVNGHPVVPDYGPGPMEAIEDFLKETSTFVVDVTREKFLLTFNPRGYLRKATPS